MHHKPFCCAGSTQAVQYAARILSQSNLTVTHTLDWNTGHLLLDVPSFRPGSVLSQEKNLDTLLGSLPQDITIWGGNLEHPMLADFRKIDLLKLESYLQENAAITARCALKLAIPLLSSIPENSPVLIFGWGRICKYLAPLLAAQRYPVCIASRKPLQVQEYEAISANQLTASLPRFRLIINTAPAPVLSVEDSARCANCIKMDLASVKGLAGEDVIWARGLPGIHVPEESGALIARTILDILKEGKK